MKGNIARSTLLAISLLLLCNGIGLSASANTPTCSEKAALKLLGIERNYEKILTADGMIYAASEIPVDSKGTGNKSVNITRIFSKDGKSTIGYQWAPQSAKTLKLTKEDFLKSCGKSDSKQGDVFGRIYLLFGKDGHLNTVTILTDKDALK
jgi:hypothetical protein